ncbi:hypothetical protein BDQ12DRAFT_670321 [Crucibulum laeve]|uniref:Uncharacterized protein n=1 Tax=Crucibulum laeve TaxID=68775 RepID=A0A5C3LX99_9AGAR|nr:hypothetical protein BDQ12DRAFT_670321 [Crucibulum laeve]
MRHHHSLPPSSTSTPNVEVALMNEARMFFLTAKFFTDTFTFGTGGGDGDRAGASGGDREEGMETVHAVAEKGTLLIARVQGCARDNVHCLAVVNRDEETTLDMGENGSILEYGDDGDEGDGDRCVGGIRGSCERFRVSSVGDNRGGGSNGDDTAYLITLRDVAECIVALQLELGNQKVGIPDRRVRTTIIHYRQGRKPVKLAYERGLWWVLGGVLLHCE